jgi:vitamin B12/bleomycin/antimicrobial peptide transport system ATP-binding/permease protein
MHLSHGVRRADAIQGFEAAPRRSHPFAGDAWLPAVQHVAGNRRKIEEFGTERMDAKKGQPSSPTPAGPRPVVSRDGVMAQLTTLLRALAGSPRRSQLLLLAVGVVAVICTNAAGQIRLNSWQGAFYEAIEQRHMAAFTTQLMVFAVIAGGLLALVVSQTWLQAMINVRLREWLTHDLLD